jgi:Cutinase/von Willebrand factor type A domain/PKD domain
MASLRVAWSLNSRHLAVALAVILAAIGIASFGGPSAARASGPCTNVEIVGLRGSSEEYLGSEHGMGSLLGPVADTIATQLSGSVTFSAYGVPYPAVDAISGVLNGDYFTSKEIGSDMLHDYLLQRAIECPSMRFVVMGYSQGAHAAGDELAREGTFVTDRIAALVMFGDPRFNPEASYTWGSFDHRDHGLAGARSLSDFASWSSRVFSFCHQNDMICQGLGLGHGSDAHAQEKYVNDYADLVAGLVRRRLGLTQLPRVPLDLAFVIDSTGSMSSSIEEVREAVSSMVDKLEEKESDYRIGLVDYKDTDQGDPYAAQRDLDLGTDVDAFRTALAAFSVSGGGDYPEAVYSGLMKAFTGLSWRSSSRKAVILMGDAPGKDPEPETGYTLDSVLAAAHSLSPSSPASLRAAATFAAAGTGDSVAIYPLAVGGGPLETFEPLADGSGGKVFFTSGDSTVADQVLEAVDAAATPVEVVLSSVTAVRPGEQVAFSAGASYAAGEILEYAWDFDGDGLVDETTTTGQVTHAYPLSFDGFAEVTAIADDGHEGRATTPVSVSEGAPQPASAPQHLLAASPTANRLQVSWQPPFNLGGGNLLGYQFLVENQRTGRVETAGGTSAQDLFVDKLSAGEYLVTVAATTEAGPGAHAIADITVADPVTSIAGPGSLRTPSPITSGARERVKHAKCKRGFRRKKVHSRLKCVKRKHHHSKAKRAGQQR